MFEKFENSSDRAVEYNHRVIMKFVLDLMKLNMNTKNDCVLQSAFKLLNTTTGNRNITKFWLKNYTCSLQVRSSSTNSQVLFIGFKIAGNVRIIEFLKLTIVFNDIILFSILCSYLRAENVIFFQYFSQIDLSLKNSSN